MSGRDLVRMAESLLVAAVLILAPMVSYGLSYLAFQSHLLALSLMAVAAAIRTCSSPVPGQETLSRTTSNEHWR